MEKNTLDLLEKSVRIVKDAIDSGQKVDLSSDYFAHEEKLIFTIEISKVNDEFTKLDFGLISKEQAASLVRLHRSANNEKAEG